MDENKLFTDEELNLLGNDEIFRLKGNVTSKLLKFFGELNTSLNHAVLSCKEILPNEVVISTGKISRGENYLGNPWMILDYPRVFQQKDVFTFRSLCWWGHEYSFTMHISGSYLQRINDLEKRISSLVKKRIIYMHCRFTMELSFQQG